MAPFVLIQTSVPANQTAYPRVGQQYEFMHEPCSIEVATVAAATGIVQTVYSGPDLLMQEGPTTIKLANTLPVYPDDYHLEDDAAAGDRLSVVLRNTTAGAITVYTAVRITAHD